MKENISRRVAVVGGGAGGLAAAVEAGRCGARVTIIEKNNRVGKKLLKTGNGRCNLTNLHVSPADYNHPDHAAPLLRTTDCAALLDFFASLGLRTVADSEGRVYPRSDTASSVLDVLRLGAAAVGAEERCSSEVTLLLPCGGDLPRQAREKTAGASPRPTGSDCGFLLRTREGEELFFDRVIVASGGGTALVKTLGHRIVPFSPVLCPLATDTAPIRGLAGLRVKCRVHLYNSNTELCCEDGEVLFREQGVSGIVILNMSRYALPGMALSLDLMPECSREEVRALLSARPFGGGELLTGLFHRRIAEALVRLAGGAEPDALSRVIKDFRLSVKGMADTANAQVTRGGADVRQFDPLTLQSNILPGLYVIGEALDMDGRCGGFNLHWAFVSGLAAGRSAALD